MIVAIDGPAGAGKSTVARAVADRLGATYLDTGAMYRAVALRAGEEGRPPGEVAAGARIDLGEGLVRVDGRDVTAAIRTPAVSSAASRVAADPAVRAALVAQQQALVAQGDWVAEGRDIATAVAPGAEVKVFLTASPQARAQRRADELGLDPDAVLADLSARDERDAGRAQSPLRRAPGAVELDTTGLEVDEVVDRVVALARQARPAPDLRAFLAEQARLVAAGDLDALLQRYHPDAELVRLERVARGHDELRAFWRDYLQAEPELVSLDGFVSTDSTLVYHATLRTAEGIVRDYGALVLREGRIWRQIAGRFPS